MLIVRDSYIPVVDHEREEGIEIEMFSGLISAIATTPHTPVHINYLIANPAWNWSQITNIILPHLAPSEISVGSK